MRFESNTVMSDALRTSTVTSSEGTLAIVEGSKVKGHSLRFYALLPPNEGCGFKPAPEDDKIVVSQSPMGAFIVVGNSKQELAIYDASTYQEVKRELNCRSDVVWT